MDPDFDYPFLNHDYFQSNHSSFSYDDLHFTRPFYHHHPNGTVIFAAAAAANAMLNGTMYFENDTITYEDQHHQQQPQSFLPIWFIINGLCISIIAFLGIIGNFLSAIVLSRPQMRSSVTCLLLGLTFCDTMLISISILIFGLPAISDYTGTMLYYSHIYYPILVPYLFPISITAQTGSVYLTLSVTIERYVAVCHPLHARSLCTWSRARFCVFLVILLSSLYNLPRWFEVCTSETGQHFDDEVNSTVYFNEMCEMRANDMYKLIYINWMYLFVMYLVPFSGLVVFNWAIYEQVRRANLTRCTLSKLQRREMSLATMLLFVVTVFLLCNILPLVNNVLESFYNRSHDWLVQLSNFLVVLNSSVNFVIYCSCGERFRRLLVRLCRQLMKCERAHQHYHHQHLLRYQEHGQRTMRMGAVSSYSFKGSGVGGGVGAGASGDGKGSTSNSHSKSSRRKDSSCLLNGNNSSGNGNSRSSSNNGRKYKRNKNKRNQLGLEGEIEIEDLSMVSLNPSNQTASILITPPKSSNIINNGHGHTSSTASTTDKHERHGMLVIDLSSTTSNTSVVR